MVATAFYILLSIASFFLVLSALVFFHELGHYGVARAFKMKVERFSIGFGKPIYAWTNEAGERWMISRIPLGGYVKFAGDAGAASNPDSEQLAKLRSEQGDDVKDIFHFRPVWQRALVVLAGPIANFILAALLFAIAVMWVGTSHTQSVIGSVLADSPAARAGMQPGDKIIAMDGRDVSDFNELRNHVIMRSGTPIQTVILRRGQEIDLTLTPTRVDDRDIIGGAMTRGQIGITLPENPVIDTRRYGPISALTFGTQEVGRMLSSTGYYIARIFTGREDGKQLGSVGRIAAITGKSTYDLASADASLGDRLRALTLRLIYLGAGISVALGFANLLPIPMLDGGHLVFYSYEAVAGKPLSQSKQEAGFKFGIAILMLLFLVLLMNDIGYIGSLLS